MCSSRVVLPAPRKPDSRVTGSRESDEAEGDGSRMGIVKRSGEKMEGRSSEELVGRMRLKARKITLGCMSCALARSSLVRQQMRLRRGTASRAVDPEGDLSSGCFRHPLLLLWRSYSQEIEEDLICIDVHVSSSVGLIIEKGQMGGRRRSGSSCRVSFACKSPSPSTHPPVPSLLRACSFPGWSRRS